MSDRVRVRVNGPIPIESRAAAHLGKTGTATNPSQEGAFVVLDDGPADWFLWSELVKIGDEP